MSLDYPSTLPKPTKAAHSPRNRVSATDVPGPAAYAGRERDYSGTMAVEFFFTAEQAAVFYTWWRDELLYGGRWFNCSWPALRAGAMVVQFLQEPAFNHVYNGACRISAVVQVRGASLAVNNLGDAFYPQTLLLLHGDGSNGSTTFLDSGPYNHAMGIVSGTPTISTAQKVFGTGSILGAGSTRIYTFRNGAEWTTDNWTLEFRYFRTSNSGYHALGYLHDNLQVYFDDPTGGSGTWRLRIILNGSLLNQSVSASVLNTWGAWAISVAKVSTTYTYRIFAEGALETTGTSAGTNLSLFTNPGQLYELGRHDTAGFAGMTGHVEEYRLTAGCRYTASYDLATAAFPERAY